MIITSTDGLNWTVVTETYEYILINVVFENGLFAALSSSIAISEDGLHWTEQSVAQKPYYDMCFADGKLLGVGYRGAVIQSLPVDPPVGPAVFANGADVPITVARGETVEVSVTMNASAYAGIQADWWMIAIPNFGDKWYYLAPSGWCEAPAGNLGALHPAYQGPLTDLTEPVCVLPAMPLPTGSYMFCFVVDQRDGILNYPQGPYLLKTVNVTVE